MNQDRIMNALEEAENNAKITAEHYSGGLIWLIFYLTKAVIYALIYIGKQIGRDKPVQYDL